MQDERNCPFYEGREAVPPDMFAGRKDLREAFADITWARPKKRQDIVWVVEGPPSYGKSSFAQWCSDAIINNDPQGDVIFSKFSLLTKFSKDKPVNTEEFYKYLSQVFFQDFRARTPRPRFRWAVKMTKRFFAGAYEIFQEGEYFGLKLPRLSFIGPINAHQYLQNVANLTAYAKNNLKTCVFVIDDVSVVEGGEQVCAEFIERLKDYSPKWTPESPNIVLILLPLPKWETIMGGTGLTRRINKTYTLQPFSIADVEDLVRSQCRKENWIWEPEFPLVLFAMSGGIPYLLQQIGVGACKASQRRSKGEYRLTAEDVVEATVADADVLKAIEVTMENVFDFLPETYIKTAIDSDILSRFYRHLPVDNGNWIERYTQGVEGMSKEEWRSRVLDTTPSKKQHNASFEMWWGHFASRGILVKQAGRPDHFCFCAEAIRRSLDVDRFNT